MTTTQTMTQKHWVAEHSGTGDARVVQTGWLNKDGTPFTPVIVPRTSWENARLIAAAPLLLEALQILVNLINDDDSRYKCWKTDVARAVRALNAAEGGHHD